MVLDISTPTYLTYQCMPLVGITWIKLKSINGSSHASSSIFNQIVLKHDQTSPLTQPSPWPLEHLFLSLWFTLAATTEPLLAGYSWRGRERETYAFFCKIFERSCGRLFLFLSNQTIGEYTQPAHDLTPSPSLLHVPFGWIAPERCCTLPEHHFWPMALPGHQSPASLTTIYSSGPQVIPVT
jgi:hypothetical protein